MFVWKGEAQEVLLVGTFLKSWNDRVVMEKEGNQWVYMGTVYLAWDVEYGEEEILL